MCAQTATGRTWPRLTACRRWAQPRLLLRPQGAEANSALRSSSSSCPAELAPWLCGGPAVQSPRWRKRRAASLQSEALLLQPWAASASLTCTGHNHRRIQATHNSLDALREQYKVLTESHHVPKSSMHQHWKLSLSCTVTQQFNDRATRSHSAAGWNVNALGTTGPAVCSSEPKKKKKKY
mmetsp:Transcript_43527/g.87769  ORF Transcript_43527/g.87769 Transcript_43527/m.87769 type:complete len:180 (-) Transcript_43527:14-553(-)